MKKNMELLIYEFLGIKKFKKGFLNFYNATLSPLTRDMSKEEKNSFLYDKMSSNYIGKERDKDTLKKYRKKIYFYLSYFLPCMLISIPTTISILRNIPSIITAIIFITSSIFFTYTTILQRYNLIRINHVIKKMEPKYKREKEREKEVIKKTLANQYTYKIVNNKKKEESITSIDEIVKNSSLEQLRNYRKQLEKIDKINSMTNKYYNSNQREDIIIPINDNKQYKLEYKKQD